MNITTKLAIASAFVALAACGGSNSANNSADMNATDMNSGMTDMNAGTTDMNATDMNAGGMTDMNATGNTDMNAGMSGNASTSTGATTNNGM